MAQQIIFLGTNANDHTGESLRGGGGMINNNFTELYALQSQTINAGALDYNFTGATDEQRIQLAITDALTRAFDRVYVPAFMLPYDASLVTFDSTVQMVREGGDASVYDVRAYGAAGDFSQDDTVAIQAAIIAASTNPPATLQGGVVYVPPGTYKITSGLTIPVALNQNQVILRGAGMRVSYLRPAGDSANFTTPVVLFGTAIPDPSGMTTNTTQYCGMEHISLSGASLTGTTAVTAVQMTQMQRGWISHSIIEGFQITGSIGLYLRGSTTTGIGASAAPHTWRCSFYHVTVATTRRPLVIENGDENDFHSCNWGLPTGLTSGTNIAVEVVQGHNNRFYGGLLSGTTNTTDRVNYWGFRLRNPTKGDVSGIEGYGIVGEGFDVLLYVESATVHTVEFRKLGVSVCRAAFNNGSDDGASSAERGNNVTIELENTNNIIYRAGRHAGSEQVAITGATPSVVKGNLFYTANGGATTITSLLNGLNGQVLTVRLDANTTIQHGTGANNIRCPGAANITPAAHKVVMLQNIASLWYVLSISTDA